MQDVVNVLPRLRQEHIELMGLCHRMRNYLRTRDTPDQKELEAIRGALDHALSAHLVVEDDIVYPALLLHRDDNIVGLAKRFIDEMGTLGEWWRDYMKQWTAHAVLADWVGFRSATFHLLEALEARIALENRDLFRMVERLTEASKPTGFAAKV